MPAINVVEKVGAIQYTGSNSAEIDSLITNFDIVSESGGVLTAESPTGNAVPTINTGNWISYSQGAVVSVQSNTEFNNSYIRNAIYSDLAAVSGVLSAGVKECPLLVVGNTTVSVDLIPAMPSSSYTANAQLFASVSVLSNLAISSVTVVDADTVDVVVNNTGLVSLTGANILVTATA